MRVVFLLAGAAGLLAARPAMAQADTSGPPAFSPWSLGARAGIGFSPQAETSTMVFVGGLTGNYYDAPHRCSFQLGAWLEDEQVNPYGTSSVHSPLLVLPVLLRTGSPASRLHFIAGGGPAIHLAQRDIPNLYYQFDYRYSRVVGCLVAGLEARLTPPKRLETTLALTVRVPFGSSLAKTNYSNHAPGSYPDQVYTGWLGIAVNVYFHPAARP